MRRILPREWQAARRAGDRLAGQRIAPVLPSGDDGRPRFHRLARLPETRHQANQQHKHHRAETSHHGASPRTSAFQCGAQAPIEAGVRVVDTRKVTSLEGARTGR